MKKKANVDLGNGKIFEIINESFPFARWFEWLFPCVLTIKFDNKSYQYKSGWFSVKYIEVN